MVLSRHCFYSLRKSIMKTVLVTAATRMELAALMEAVGGETRSDAACPAFFEGRLGECDVIAAVTGIGKVNTAMGLTMLLGRYRPGLVINTGCAGAYPGSGLAAGDLAVATTEIYGEEGVETRGGWLSLEKIGLPLYDRGNGRYFNEIPLSASAREDAMDIARELGQTLVAGKFITVSACSGSEARGRELATRFGAVCENMEGAAAAQVALCHGVDCLEIRGISNDVEDRDLSRWNIPLAVEKVQQFLLRAIPSLLAGGRSSHR